MSKGTKESSVQMKEGLITDEALGKCKERNGEHCVDIETSGMNQRGENTIPGHSTVILPSRDAGSWPVEKRIQ